MSTVSEVAPIRIRRSPAKASPVNLTIGIGLGILALAYGPLLYAHGATLWAKSHYEFFPLVLIGSGLLAWNASKRLGVLTPGRYKWLSIAGAAVCLLLLVWGALIDAPLFGITSFLFGILVFLYSYGGWTLTWRMFPAWIFLWLAVPPPRNYDQRLIVWLQSSTSSWSGYVLDLFGVLHLMSGNIVEVPGKPLMVEQACSGINSLFAIITCSVFFIFWSRRGIVHAILLLAAGVGWVLVGNLARVVIIALAWSKRGIDLAEGWKHEALGFAIFFVLLVLVWSTDRLLMFLIATANSLVFWRRTQMSRQLQAKLERNQPTDLGSTRWPDLGYAWVFAKPAMAVLLLVALYNCSLLAMGLSATPPVSAEKMHERFVQLDDKFFPATINGWQQIGFRPEERKLSDIAGQYSRTWSFKKGELNVVVSLDYAWATFHDLQVCYDSTGWQLANRKEHETPLGTGRVDHVVELNMTKPLGRSGYLLFTEFEADGIAADLPNETIRQRLTKFSFKPKKRMLTYQVQLFTDTFTPLSDAEKADCRQLFEICRQRLAQVAPERAGN